jgi:hypothetical protein
VKGTAGFILSVTRLVVPVRAKADLVLVWRTSIEPWPATKSAEEPSARTCEASAIKPAMEGGRTMETAAHMSATMETAMHCCVCGKGKSEDQWDCVGDSLVTGRDPVISLVHGMCSLLCRD